MAGKAGAYQASPNRLVSSSVLGGFSSIMWSTLNENNYSDVNKVHERHQL